MRNKVIAISVLFMLASVAVPIMAKPIGPQKAAGKNPNLMSTPEGVEILSPSGGFQSWTNDTEFWYTDFMNGLDASKAKIPNALALTIADIIEMMTDPEVALEAENKWGYISYEVLVDLFILEGYSPEEAEETAAMWPEGVYVRFVNVAK